jgi:hypothetical protein
VIVQAFKTKTPFIIDSLVRSVVISFSLFGAGLVAAALGSEPARVLLHSLALMSPPVVVYLSLKQGERNRGPMPTLPPRP